MSATERLRALAEEERLICDQRAEEWSEVVERAYHVGRRLAFKEAAEIVNEHEERKTYVHHHD